MAKEQRQTAGRATRPAPKTSWNWKRISVPVIITLLIGVSGYFLAQQKEIWEGRLNQSKEQLEVSQKENDRLKQELEAVKQDLKVYVEKEKGLPDNPDSNGKPFQFTLMKSLPTNVEQGLKMTLTDLVFQTNPARYTATARVTYQNLPELRILSADVGYKVTYPEKNGYDIQLIKTNSVSATFTVKKNSN